MPYFPYLRSLFTTNCEGIHTFKRPSSHTSVVTCGPAIVFSPQAETVKKYCNELIHNGIPFIDIMPSIMSIDNAKVILMQKNSTFLAWENSRHRGI